jgi:DHA2 family lincomycin resistance protein-like MFS transporter
MLGLYLGTFNGMFSETSLNIALPQLRAVFHISTGIAQWLVIGYMLMIGIILPFSSLLMKWFSARGLTFFSLGSSIIGSLISGFAPDFPILLAGRVIQGVGTGMILPITFSVIFEVFTVDRIGAAMGVASLVIMFAPVIGPTLSGILLGMLSWRWIFFSFVIILVVAMTFALIYMVNPYKLTKPKIDGISCLTSLIGFGGIVLGVSLVSEFGFLLPIVLIFIVGLVAIVIYAYKQLHMENPVLNLKALLISGFRTGAVLLMLDFGIAISTMYLLPQYLQNGMMIPAATAGLILLPGGLINALVSYLSGRFYDRFGAKYLIRVGFLISLVGVVSLLFTSSDSSIAYVILCHIVLMIGIPLVTAPAQTSGMNALPSHLSRDGSTIINTMQQIIGAICTSVATWLLGIGQSLYFANGGNHETEAFTLGSKYGFYFALLLALVGFLLSFRMKETKMGKR